MPKRNQFHVKRTLNYGHLLKSHAFCTINQQNVAKTCLEEFIMTFDRFNYLFTSFVFWRFISK